MKKAAYIAIGIDLSGRKNILGMWVGENENDKYWPTILNGLRNRGVEDILIACTDILRITLNSTGIASVLCMDSSFRCWLNMKRGRMWR